MHKGSQRCLFATCHVRSCLLQRITRGGWKSDAQAIKTPCGTLPFRTSTLPWSNYEAEAKVMHKVSKHHVALCLLLALCPPSQVRTWVKRHNKNVRWLSPLKRSFWGSRVVSCSSLSRRGYTPLDRDSPLSNSGGIPGSSWGCLPWLSGRSSNVTRPLNLGNLQFIQCIQINQLVTTEWEW